jgi:hypothetical protein
MRVTHFATAMTFAGAMLVSCAALAWDQDPFAQYLQRSNKITLSAGNAKEVNAATHVIDPWPRYVGNRRIPGNGERMAGAAERYRDVSKLPLAPRPIFTPVPTGGGGGAGAGAAPR